MFISVQCASKNGASVEECIRCSVSVQDSLRNSKKKMHLLVIVVDRFFGPGGE